MARSNVLPFRRRSRRPPRPARPTPIDETTVAAGLRRFLTEYPDKGEWLKDVTTFRDVRCESIGRDFVVTISAPLQMATADLTEWEQQQLA